MEQTKVKGIVIFSQDYKEKDKLVTLLTPIGKLLVLAKGVKNPNAKLKSTTMPFCFADFVLDKKGEMYILTSAEIIDTFFDVTKDYDKYVIASKILEFANRLAIDDTQSILVLSLKTLKMVAYEEVNPKIVLIKHLLELLTILGFKLNFNFCASCKGPLMTKIYYDFSSGELVCPACKNNYCKEISKAVYSVLRLINNQDTISLATLKFANDMLDETIDLLFKSYNFKFSINVKNI